MRTSSPAAAGSVHVAAALAFHLPGARLDMSGPDGKRCSVGPLTDPRSMLHPAEFRELIIANGTLSDANPTAPDGPLGSMTKLSLATAMPGLRHVGNGLYRITGKDVTAYAFATTLPAIRVDQVLSHMQAEIPLEYGSGQPAGAAPDQDVVQTISVSLIHDEGLAVTMVVMCGSGTRDGVGEEIARSAATACLVAEVEYSLMSE